jgi:hypothetical protein
MQALDARMAERTAGLVRLLQERADKELSDSHAILSELRASILAELDTPEVRQLSLFTTDVQDQAKRSVDSLRARAEAIPAEIEREAQAIKARYANPTPHLFPVAVTYLVPERSARGEGRAA